MDISAIGQQWYFWVILIVIIAFIVYSGLKKKKKEQVERKKREKEVKDLIKQHLRENDALFNVSVEYLDVKPRTSKSYRDRDVYDVFVEIREPKKKLFITKKAYEIEGFAKLKNDTLDAKKPKDEEIIVKWNINKEFNYKEHKKIMEKELPGKISIFVKSVFKKNRKQYINQQMLRKKKFIAKKAAINSETKTIQDTEVFRPSFKKKDEKF